MMLPDSSASRYSKRRRLLPLYPISSPQTVVFGAPIDAPALAAGTEPTEAQVDELHARYTAAVVDLYEKHKADAGYGPEETLKIV